MKLIFGVVVFVVFVIPMLLLMSLAWVFGVPFKLKYKDGTSETYRWFTRIE